MNATKTLLAAFFFGFVLFAACGRQLYKVAPSPLGRPPEISTDNLNGLNIGARLIDGDRSLEQFEANLPMAGVLAIDIRLSNPTSKTLDARSLRFELIDGTGRRFKPVPPRKALSRIMKWNGDKFYTLEARRLTRESYEALALKLDRGIGTSEERRGFLFFDTRDGSSNLSHLSLSVTGTAVPLLMELSTY